MRTLRRLIYGEVLGATGFVLVAFLALFSFFNLVDELASVGKVSVVDSHLVYGLWQAVLYVLLLVPNLTYELLPIALLIGSVFVLVRLAQASEYTILRTSGLGPGRALKTLLTLGLVFVVLTFAIGDYLAPVANRTGQLLKARYEGRVSIGQTGAWLKETQGERHYSVNVAAMDASGELHDIRIFEFSSDGTVTSTTRAETGHVDGDNAWHLQQVQRRDFGKAQHAQPVEQQDLPNWDWPTNLSAEMVSVALLNPERMRTLDLFRYSRHLKENGQTAQRYEIEFWRKVFYPLSCLVMVVLALPFAYLHFRSGGVTGYVFIGVMLGISFFLLNIMFGYIGNLRAWQPWLAAAAPSIVYSAGSLGAFGWLVLRR